MFGDTRQQIRDLQGSIGDKLGEIKGMPGMVSAQVRAEANKMAKDTRALLRQGRNEEAQELTRKMEKFTKDFSRGVDLLVKENRKQTTAFEEFGTNLAGAGRVFAGSKSVIGSLGRGDLIGAWTGSEQMWRGITDIGRSPFTGPAMWASRKMAKHAPGLSKQLTGGLGLKPEDMAVALAPKILAAGGAMTMAVAAVAAAIVGGYQLQKQFYEAGSKDVMSTLRLSGALGGGVNTDTRTYYGGVGHMGLMGNYMPLDQQQIEAMVMALSRGTRRSGASLVRDDIATMESVAQNIYRMQPGQLSGGIAALEARGGRDTNLAGLFNRMSRYSRGPESEMGQFYDAVVNVTGALMDASPAVRDFEESMTEGIAQVIGFAQQGGIDPAKFAAMVQRDISQADQLTANPAAFFKEQFFTGKSMKEIMLPETYYQNPDRVREVARRTQQTISDVYSPILDTLNFSGQEGDIYTKRQMKSQGFDVEAELSFAESRDKSDFVNPTLKHTARTRRDSNLDSMVKKEVIAQQEIQELREKSIQEEAVLAMAAIDKMTKRFQGGLMEMAGATEKFAGKLTESATRINNIKTLR